MNYFQPRALLQLDVPKWDSNTEFISFEVTPIEVKWTKNHHLAADELTVTIGYREGGVDPRMLKNARGALWLWDEASQTFNSEDHLRFTGICKKPSRKLSDEGSWQVDLTFLDYTTMFLNMKPFPSDGMPEWTDTLLTTWRKLCDNTGYRDPASGKIVSSVKALRDSVRFDPPELATRTLGEMVSARFHAISKPTPKPRSDAWAVWQWCVGSLGLVSYIDRGACIVTTTNEHYKEEQAPLILYGRNIMSLEESADTEISVKGILLKSFDPLRGVLLEARYPSPADERIKKKRADAKRALKEERDVSLNEASAEYMEFEYHHITDQRTLNARAEEAYLEFSKQELTGSVHIAGMKLFGVDGLPVDPLELRAGDCIYVGIEDESEEGARHLQSEEEKVRYLIEHCGYIRPVAQLVARNLGERALEKPVFHVDTLEVTLKPDSFDIEIKYHNLVKLSGVFD